MNARVRVLGAALVLLTGCSEKRQTPNASDQPSPNASIVPAPLASAPEPTPSHSTALGIPADSAGRLMVREQEPEPPEPIPTDHALSPDTLTAKDVAGYTLEGQFQWADLPPPPSGPEVARDAIRAALAKTDFDVTVDLAAAGRMRFQFVSPTFPLPANAELRSHRDYYGHVLLWPNGMTYRALPPGSLRAMFAERRADVSPLLRAKVSAAGSGSLLGHKTQRSAVATSLGVLTLEQAVVPGSGAGGELLCRFLVELVGADPSTDACRTERIPLSARYKWASSGSLSFVATSLVERKELPLGYIYVPPAAARFTIGELPPATSGIFLDRTTLSKFRTRPVHEGPPAPHAPGEGLIAVNDTMMLAYVLIDGVPTAWVKPRAEQYIIGPPAGRYSIAWRDFFGTTVTTPKPTDLPAIVRTGDRESDAGVRR